MARSRTRSARAAPVRTGAPLDIAPSPVAPSPVASGRLAGAVAGDAGSAQSLARLNQAIAEMRAQAVLPLLRHALAALSAERHQEGAEIALKALNLDERCALGWHILAICREKAGDFSNSIRCYETALQLSPEDPEIANDLGRLAYRMGHKVLAEQLFNHYLTRRPGSPEGANNLACALRDQMRFGEAIDVIRPVIQAWPDQPLLWNTLATILSEQGDMPGALTFLDEALRLDPGFAKARYNRANALLALGDPAGALAECDAALPGAIPGAEAAMMRLARSTMLVASGRLGEGWDGYEARLDPQFADVTLFQVDAPLWSPDQPLESRSLLLIGEQGLGDEVLFANVLPDVLAELGPEGRLTLALEPRLIPLFRRSFPGVEIGAHLTAKIEHHTVRVAPQAGVIDLWAPLAAPLRRFRRTVESFPARDRFLVPDPARVSHWRGVLAQLGDAPKVGLVWKSLKIDSARLRYFSPFDQWAPVLRTPGVAFINLQYGDCSEELARARTELGVDIWDPPGIDLKDELDEVAAFSAALDLVIGPANASTNIAAAVGAPVWLVSTPGAWPKLGADRYPWYPQARVFTPPAYDRWAPVMAEVAEALGAFAAG